MFICPLIYFYFLALFIIQIYTYFSILLRVAGECSFYLFPRFMVKKSRSLMCLRSECFLFNRCDISFI